jgi:hypothetical protein
LIDDNPSVLHYHRHLTNLISGEGSFVTQVAVITNPPNRQVAVTADPPLRVDVVSGGSGGSSNAAEIQSIDSKLPALVSGGVPVAPNVARGAGNVDAVTQRVTLAAGDPAVTTIGAQVDAAAAADGLGNYGIVAALKRGLLNWSALLGRIPVAVSGRVPVDGSGVTQPVSASALPLPSGAATEATLAALNTKIPAQAITGLLPVDTLGTPGAPRVQPTTGTAAGIALTPTCRRVSMFATAGAWYSLSGTATATSPYIGAGERLDFDVPASTTISVLRETTDGSIRITELV